MYLPKEFRKKNLGNFMHRVQRYDSAKSMGCDSITLYIGTYILTQLLTYLRLLSFFQATTNFMASRAYSELLVTVMRPLILQHHLRRHLLAALKTIIVEIYANVPRDLLSQLMHKTAHSGLEYSNALNNNQILLQNTTRPKSTAIIRHNHSICM